MNRRKFYNAEKILVRGANWVGDAIMTTPAVEAIKRNFPAAHVTMLAKPWVIPVYMNNPHIDEIMLYDVDHRHKGALRVIPLSKDLHRRKFDLAILFQNAFEAALLAWLARIPNRMGYTTDARTLLLTHRIRGWRPLKQGHLIDYYLGLLSQAGLNVINRELNIYLTDEEKRAAQNHLLSMGATENQLIIGINPGATYGTAKRWPADRYIALSRKFIKEHHACVLIFGGPGEATLGEQIASGVGSGIINLCNQTNLREAMALIGCCDAMVTNDSGLMHVAAALDTPQVAIIGPTDPVATGPVNQSSRLVQRTDSCHMAPCLKPHCPIDHRCMTAIDLEQVYDETLSLIRRRNI